MNEARKTIYKQLGPDVFPGERAGIRVYLKNVPGWLRKGYRKALKRYSRCAPWKLTNAFQEIEEKADKFLKWDESDYSPLVVSFDSKKTCQLTIYLEEPEYPEED